VSSRFADQYGTELEVSGETALPGCARVWVSGRCGIHVRAAGFPAFIAALYEAAGLPAPVILERPAVPKDGARLRFGKFGMRMLNGGIAFSLPGVEVEAVPPGAARELAAHIAAYADEAEGEPDPDDVTELAEEIRGDLARIGGRPDEATEIAARAALRWFRDKQQRGESRDG
jgi:hypothetical protein